MAIMFAGGITVAGSSIAFAPDMPEAIATHGDGNTSGKLSVSSTHVMGGAVVAITVDDSAIGATDQQIAPPSVSFGDTSLDMTQMSDGSWVSYVVDHYTSTLLDETNHPAVAGGAWGYYLGQYCPGGIGANNVAAASGKVETTSGYGDQDYDITTKDVYAPVSQSLRGLGAGGDQLIADIKQFCTHSQDEEGAGRQWSSVLTDAPAINSNSGAGTNNTGQRNMILNSTTGYTAWPFIQAINFSSTQDVSYGSDAVTVEWGNSHDTSLTVDREIYPDNAVVHMTITDPGLNYDPTAQDIWIMDANSETLYFWNNSSYAAATGQTTNTFCSAQVTCVNDAISQDGNTNPVIPTAVMGDVGCGDNCVLSAGGSPKNVINTNSSKAYYGFTNITMTETGDNTGVFESSDLLTATNATANSQMTFSYGGDTVTLIIGYEDATVTFDAGDSWLPVETATYTISDNDMNKDSKSTETLDIGDPHDRIPTVQVGSPISFSDYITSGNNWCTQGGHGSTNSAVCISETSGTDGSPDDLEHYYSVSSQNTTDTSKRIHITVDGMSSYEQAHGNVNVDEDSNTITWLNVTAGVTAQTLVDLPGTAAIQYDISGIADALGSSAIDAYMAQTPFGATSINGSINDVGTSVISIVSSGNVKSGIFDMDDTTGNAAGSTDVDATATSRVGVEDTADVWGTVTTDPLKNETAIVSVMFQIAHPAGATLAANGTCNSGSAAGKYAGSCYGEYAIAIDIVNWDPDNSSDVHNGIYRMEAEETGDNTGVFEGAVSYALLSEATSATSSGTGTTGFSTGGHDGSAAPSSGVPAPAAGFNGPDLTILLTNSISGSSAPRVNINDTYGDGGSGSTIGIQIDTVSHTGSGEFDAINYGDGDTATITITDYDLNQDSSARETYVNSSKTFQVMIDDDDSQHSTDQTIIETSADSGVFVGTFVVPTKLGQDMELQYYDAVDATGDSSTTYSVASIASNDGSIALDRSSYPVPYLASKLNEGDNTDMVTGAGNVAATLTVTEPDNSADTLTTNSKMSFERGNVLVKLGGSYVYSAGEPRTYSATTSAVQALGPLSETEQGSGMFEIDFEIGGTTCSYGTTDSGACQAGVSGGSTLPVNSTTIMQVEYVDTSDAAGGTSTFYDSAIFELHTGTLTLDKDVYVMGEDAVITLTDADLNLDYDTSEQYDLRLIEWDSSANSSVLLHKSYCTSGCTLDPSNLTETGDNSGVFQTVFTIPTSIVEENGAATSPEMGEGVTLTYRDVGLSGEKSYQDDELDIEASFTISKFGAIVELDKAVYDWTDTVYITITAPDWNQNANTEETIGTTALQINANTRQGKMCSSSESYTLAETNENTGVFDGEIAITGFTHTMASSQTYTAPSSDTCTGNTDGKLRTAGNMDGITVSYEWVDGSIAIASAIIQWNIGEIEFTDSAVSPNGSTLVRVTDVDEDTDSTIIDTFKVDVFSDSDSGGVQATVSETGEDTGVFEAIVYFTDSAATSGLTLRVSEGDTVTVEYTDVTLPGPDYTTSDDLTIAATTTVGTTVPPLERAPAANARVVDAFGSSVAEVSVDQQVQIAADVANSQGKEQAFAYLVQVQDGNGVTVSLAWITGSLNAGQSMSPALSWTPSAAGSYTATVFVWESVDNPVALSPTVSVGIDVV